MLPRWHILYGALFAIFLGVVSPSTPFSYLFIVFLSSVFIDLDHYFCAVKNTGKISLLKAFVYHSRQDLTLRRLEKNGKRPRGDFHLFHTLEFHLLIAVLGMFWTPFFYLFIGMVFHSFLDIFSLLKSGKIHRREYFLIRWLQRYF